MLGARRIAGWPPAILLFGLLVPRVALADWPLAVQLFAEKDWCQCRRECLRVLSEHPRWPPAEALAGVARLWSDGDMQVVARIEAVLPAVDDPELQAAIHYEAGRFLRSRDYVHLAAQHFENAFLTAGDSRTGALAGCALFRILREKNSVVEVRPGTRIQLETMAPTWGEDIWRATDSQASTPVFSSKPAEWIVAVYRRQVAPAIGARCSLSPSCSEYFLEAGRRHGLAAFPITADRLVREPSVVQQGEHPIFRDGRVRYRDELEWHTYWWTGRGNPW